MEAHLASLSTRPWLHPAHARPIPTPGAGVQGDPSRSVGVSWNAATRHAQRSRHVAGFLAISLALVNLTPVAGIVGRATGDLVSVIVREQPGAGTAPEHAVEAMGGTVGRQIGIINGFVATVPSGGIARLQANRDVLTVSPNGRVTLSHSTDGLDGSTDAGSMYNTAWATGARYYWGKGFTGKGVDVALIDTGIVPVKGLDAAGKVINGADLSFESQADNLRYLDTYGHGTHMAGIIAGKDPNAATPLSQNHDDFIGMAPDARVVNVKVANAMGTVDVSQVIAAIDWVVAHKNDNGMNIRVLNLSFGTDGVQDYVLDPLSYAAEVAWRKGIVVVVAAGNAGFGSAKLNNPAYNPFVIAVGADDTKGTNALNDDTIPSFSSTGDGTRNPDFVAPGKSIVSLRAPGSYLDQAHSEGRIGDRYFRGSGTSQAAAVVSGLAALIIQQRPSITPDQLKDLLRRTASPLPSADQIAQGKGLVKLDRAYDTATNLLAVQSHLKGTGLGSLEQARGSAHVASPEGVELRGEMDIFGAAWLPDVWASACLLGNSWSGGTWNGNSWSGNSWSGNSWSGNSWSGSVWLGISWGR